MLGWFWRGWWGTAWGDPAGVWEVWQGGECCHLPGSIQMEIKQDQSCGQICELNLFHRRNKMTQMTPRYMSKFSSSSTRVSRQKRPRMDLMEGRNSLLSPLHFWNSNFSDFLVAGQCRLWSTTKRCTISKIFQPRWHVVFSLLAELNYRLVLKCVGIQKLLDHGGVFTGHWHWLPNFGQGPLKLFMYVKDTFSRMNVKPYRCEPT